MDSVFEAINNRFAPGGDKPAFYTDMAGRLRLHEARQRETFPYCVYVLLGGSLERFFNAERQEALSIQFSIYSNEPSAANICSYYDNIKLLFDNCSLTITNWTGLWMQRRWAYLTSIEEDDVWHYAVQYRLLIEN